MEKEDEKKSTMRPAMPQWNRLIWKQYMVMATIDVCLMLINFAKYFANSWCASIHHYISLFIFYDQFLLAVHSLPVYTNDALKVNISRRINVIIHMCILYCIDNDILFAQIFHILSRSSRQTFVTYFRWGFFSASPSHNFLFLSSLEIRTCLLNFQYNWF